MPPYKVAAVALKETTERLAREVSEPTDSRPDWNELEWAIARSAAAMQGITALLANRIRWAGPPPWQSFMNEQKRQSLLRHAKICQLLSAIDDAFRRVEVGAVALKGAALLDLNLYAPGERPMGDVDLLVHPIDLSRVAQALRHLDYQLAYTAKRHAVFEPLVKKSPQSFAEHVDFPLKIEVHTVVAESLPYSKVEITDNLWSQFGPYGLKSYPTLSALMMHLVLHCAGNMRAHAMRQIQIHDIAVLGRRFTQTDWENLIVDRVTGAKRWWLFPPFALAEFYYAGSVPRDALCEMRAACPVALRLAVDRETVTNVSWSNLRIHAFPGITWSRTPLEALRYIRSRVFPPRTALEELKAGRQSQARPEPVPWYDISHSRRIFRWLFCSPPRVQTLASLHEALKPTIHRL